MQAYTYSIYQNKRIKEVFKTLNRTTPLRFLLFLLGLSFCTTAVGQSSWTAGVSTQIGIQFFDKHETKMNSLPDTVFGEFQNPFYSSYLTYSLQVEGNYNLNKYFTLNLGLAYTSFTNGTGARTGTIGTIFYGSENVRFTREEHFNIGTLWFKPQILFDFAFNQPNEFLFVGVGTQIGYRWQNARYGEVIDTSTNYYNLLDTQRKGLSYAVLVSLQWQKFFTPKFGYSIGLQYTLPYIFTPTKFTVNEVITEYQRQTDREGAYTYNATQENWIDGKSIKQEKFSMQEIYISFGIMYRL